jgi:nitrous oxidase accessory protein
MKTSSLLVCLAFCVTLATQISSAQTVYVGSCRPHQVSYPTISAAVAAVAANTTVDICPGTYPESVTITTPLTLKGLTSVPGTRTVFVQSISVQDTGPVNISNVVVDGNGGNIGGIEYSGGDGTIENVDVRVGGIAAVGFPTNMGGRGSDLTVQHSSISGGGFYAAGTVGGGSELNLTSNWITCGDGCTAVDYENGANGLMQGNTIILSGGTGIGVLLDYYFGTTTVTDNTIVGGYEGIGLASSEHPIVVTNNHLYNNGIGVYSGQYSGAGGTINSNTIVQSSVAAISFLHCNDGFDNTYEHNTIVNAPIGIANVSTQDVSGGNTFYDVTTPTTACPAP